MCRWRGQKKNKSEGCRVCEGDSRRERMQEMWLLTSPINKVRLSLRGGRREQLVVVLVGAEGAGVVPLASVHDGVGHHDVAQRVVQVAVQQAALVLGRRHVLLGQGGGFGGRAQPCTHAHAHAHTHAHTHTHGHAHAHHGGALFLDHALVHGLVELLGAALCPLRVVPVYTSRQNHKKKNLDALQKYILQILVLYHIYHMISVFLLIHTYRIKKEYK